MADNRLKSQTPCSQHRGPMLRACQVASALLFAASLCTATPACADPVKGEIGVTTEGGYARLLIRLDEEVDAKVRVDGAVMIISFTKPVDVAVEKLNAIAPAYISAARSDPDGRAIRIAIAQKVEVNSIPAAERLYIDLLPAGWKGLKPGLPQEVIDELSRRAREAERQLDKQRLTAKRIAPTSRVKVGVQPTFNRYIFELPNLANVVPEEGDGVLKLNFDQPIKFDLADAQATLPPTMQSIDTEAEKDSATVTFHLNGTPQVRSFREDRTIVVDIGNQAVADTQPEASVAPQAGDAAAAKIADAKGPAAGPAIEAPETVPVNGAPMAPAVRPSKPATATAAPAPPAQPAPAAPLASELAPKMAAANAEPAKDTAIKEPVAQDAAAKTEQAKPEQAKDTATKDAVPKDVVPKDLALKNLAPKDTPAKPDQVAQQTPAATPAKPAAAVPKPGADADKLVKAAVHQFGANLRLDFPFNAPTPAAVFRRADVLWLVFDSEAKIDVAALMGEGERSIKSVTTEPSGDGAVVVRIRLERPRLASFSSEGTGWALTIGESVTDPSQPLQIARSIVGRNRSNIVIPFQNPRQLHRIKDPDVGDTLMIVTALGPARGFLKPQDFVELHALASTHGVAVQPLADDISAELASDKIVISRPGGLMLSTSSLSERDFGVTNPVMFDVQTWGFDREAKFQIRQSELIWKAAAAPEGKRRTPRLNLARFYMARDMIPEAKAVLDVAIADEREGDDITGVVLRAAANVMLGRPDEALKELAKPQVGSQNDAPIWRAIALARQGAWPEAREAFKTAEANLATLPIELQRMAMLEETRASIEVRDFNGAAKILNDFETIGIPYEMEAQVAVLSGRLNEGLGHRDEAIASYRTAADSRDRKAAAQGRLRELVLRYGLGDIKRKDMIDELETLTATWRGDETEGEGLKWLAHLYTEDGRYRDAFHTMRTALLAHPNTDLTRKIQDEAVATFDSLFLAGKGDTLPAIEALGLFYDYRELTPIGRRGDEMIRKLAERLVSVDLLEQAAELLQHQVDHRLQGAARSQVATRLAVIYLMNHKPAKALTAIKVTRMSDLSTDLRDQRLLIEARALSEVGRHDFALEVISTMQGPQAQRLRGDILWAGKHWREAAEQLERLHGERWQQFAPLTADERSDILRAAIGYALADETLSLARLREEYSVKMADGPDRHAFDVVTAPIGTSGKEFRDVARAVASLSTLDAFLREMHERYPDAELAKPGDAAATPKPGAAAKASDASASALPAKPPQGTPLKADPATTGSIPRLPRKRPPAR